MFLRLCLLLLVLLPEPWPWQRFGLLLLLARLFFFFLFLGFLVNDRGWTQRTCESIGFYMGRDIVWIPTIIETFRSWWVQLGDNILRHRGSRARLFVKPIVVQSKKWRVCVFDHTCTNVVNKETRCFVGTTWKLVLDVTPNKSLSKRDCKEIRRMSYTELPWKLQRWDIQTFVRGQPHCLP